MLFSSLEASALPVVMLFATPFLLKHLGDLGFGIWAFINSLAAVSGLANWGFAETVITFAPQYLKNQKKNEAADLYWTSLLGSMLAFLSVMLLVSVILTLFGSFELLAGHSLQSLHRPILAGLSLFLARVIENAAFSFFKAQIEFQLSSFYSVWSKAIGMVLQVLLLGQGYSLEFAFVSATVVSFFIILISVIHAKSRYQISFSLSLISRITTVLKKHGSFSCGVWFQSLILFVHSNLDKILVGKFLGPERLAYYSIGSLLFGQIHQFLSSGLQALLPEFSGLRVQDPSRIIKIYRDQFLILILAYGVMAIGLNGFHHFLIRLWLQEQAGSLIQILPEMSLYGFCFVLNIIPYYVLLSFEKVKKINQILVGMAVGLVGVSFLLVFDFSLNTFILARAGVALVVSLVFHLVAIPLLKYQK